MFKINTGLLLSGAGWLEYKTTTGRVVDALECQNGPEDVIDLLDSYGIHSVNWAYIGTAYVYW